MDDPRLLTLCTLVRIKNYTKTAKRLFITQPAVTHHIQSLEKNTISKSFPIRKTSRYLPKEKSWWNMPEE